MVWLFLSSIIIWYRAKDDKRFIDEDIPDERIIIAYEPNGKGNQISFGWNNKISIAQSDDFFKTSKILVERGNKFLISDVYIFVAKVVDETS